MGMASVRSAETFSPFFPFHFQIVAAEKFPQPVVSPVGLEVLAQELGIQPGTPDGGEGPGIRRKPVGDKARTGPGTAEEEIFRVMVVGRQDPFPAQLLEKREINF
jgi:hypothetical protein